MSAFLAAMTTSGWVPGPGDPDTLGWVTTIAYLATSLLCLLAWHRERRDPTAVPKFWLLLCAAMFALGINKQLDLQSWFTYEGRQLARSEGWYDRRQPVQLVFVAAIALLGLMSLAAITYLLRGRLRRYRLPLAGLLYTTCFVIIRAASFHHVDRLLDMGMEHVRVNHVLELSGISLVAIGALLPVLRQRPIQDGR